MPVTLDAYGRKAHTLDTTDAEVVFDAGGARVRPSWLLLRSLGTEVTVYVVTGGGLSDETAYASAGGVLEHRTVGAGDCEWVWVNGREVAVAGSAAEDVVVEVLA